MDETIVVLLRRYVKERKEGLAGALLRGGASDYPAYVKLAGQYAMLEEIEDEIKDLEKRFDGE